MIEKIFVTDLKNTIKYSYRNSNEYNAWISALDPEHKGKVNILRKNFAEKDVLYYNNFFYDWSDEDGPQWKHLKNGAVKKEHVQNYIKFLKSLVDSNYEYNLGVNCFAGISRSTALAIIALVMSGKMPQMALDYVLSIRPEAWPNLRILNFASEILGIDIKSPVELWKKNVLGENSIITSYDDLRQLNTKALNA